MEHFVVDPLRSPVISSIMCGIGCRPFERECDGVLIDHVTRPGDQRTFQLFYVDTYRPISQKPGLETKRYGAERRLVFPPLKGHKAPSPPYFLSSSTLVLIMRSCTRCSRTRNLLRLCSSASSAL